ncbi:hypothetical protein [Cernens ardua]|uniref:hypothetical protein n=1 Tax=Cernens ardua TaxID=3402176 RepID=UPI003F9E6980
MDTLRSLPMHHSTAIALWAILLRSISLQAFATIHVGVIHSALTIDYSDWPRLSAASIGGHWQRVNNNSPWHTKNNP